MFPFALETSNHYLRLLNTARPGESRTLASGDSVESASGESPASELEEQVDGELAAGGGELRVNISHGGGEAMELERKNEKKFTVWLQKLMRKFRRRQGHDGA